MNYFKTRAARLLAIGETLADVAKIIGKTENTLKRWMLEKEFQKVLFDNLKGAALRVIQGYLSGEHKDKDKVTAALSLLRITKSPKTKLAEIDDDEGLGEFSEAALKRLGGD